MYDSLMFRKVECRYISFLSRVFILLKRDENVAFILCKLNIEHCFPSFTYEDGWHQRRSEVSQIAISILLRRCEIILEKFLTDENDLGNFLYAYLY